VTNQTLSPSQRKTLIGLARNSSREAEILHLQQLTNLLDSPPGYGIRLQYLDILMSAEEQLSWFVDSDSQTSKALIQTAREIRALQASIERLKAAQSGIQTGQSQIFRTLGFNITTPDLISVSAFEKGDDFQSISTQLSPALILLFHRLICFDLPTRAVGQLRTGQAALMDIEGRRTRHLQPPLAEQVAPLLTSLCSDWNAHYLQLSDPSMKLDAIAKFHADFLFLHPFLDGNGRVACAVLMQQCLDFFGRADMALMNKGGDYYAALRDADQGDRTALIALIRPVIQR
jgi:Fic family protein